MFSPVSLFQGPLACFQAEKALGGRGQEQEPSLHCSGHPRRHWLGSRSDQPSLRREEGDCSDALVLRPLTHSPASLGRPLPSLERRGLSTGESRVSEIRGLQVCHTGGHAPCYL